MGESGETYLVGPDYLMRSDSFLDPEYHSVVASFADQETGSVETVAVHEALAGATDEKIVIDYNGNPVLSAYAPLTIGGTTWALLAEINEAEVRAPIQQLTMSMLIAGIIVAAVLAVSALVLANSIAAPLGKGVALADAVARGDVSQTILLRQNDEIGMLANAMRQMVANLKQTVAVAQQIARGDLTANVQVLSEQDNLGKSLSEMVSRLQEMVSSV